MMRTVFFSKDIISLFGEIYVYNHLPHGWHRYEGRTFCKVCGQFKEVKLWDLFPMASQKEFLRKYCENNLKSQPISYFSDENPLRTSLNYEDISGFIIDDQSLIIFFQPYIVGGLGDGPLHVKIPYELFRDNSDTMNTLLSILHQNITSKSFTASWDQDKCSQLEVASE